MAPPVDHGETLDKDLPPNQIGPAVLNWRANTRYVVELTFVGVIYFLLAKLGLALASIHPSATPIWPPTGFALAAVILRGQRIAPAIFLGALLANATTAGSVYAAAAIALGNTLESVTGGYLISRWRGGARTFDSPAKIAKFALICLGAATPISATIGVSVVSLSAGIGFDHIAPIWITWWLGDLAGALVLTPVLVLWMTSRPGTVERRQLIEGMAALLGACAVGAIAFSPFLGRTAQHDPLGFLVIVPLMWAALRLGQRETATIAFVLSCFAVWGTYLGAGPFGRTTLNDSFLLLVMFVISTAVPSLALSADVAVRRRTEASLRGAHTELSRQVESGSVALAETQRALRQAREMEEALRESEDRLRLAIGIAGLGTWEYDIERDLMNWSAPLSEVFGRPEWTTSSYAEWISLIHPGDRSRIKAELDAALKDDIDYNPEYRVVRPDGSERWLACRTTVLRGKDGVALKILGVGQDVTEQKAAAERQQLLIAELDHRVRNILSATQSMLLLTARNTTTKEEFANSLQGRVAAMAQAHGLVTRGQWQGIDVADLLASLLQPYGDAIALHGDRGCILRSKDAVDLALGLHELATNAAKHGALSVPAGRIRVTWSPIRGEPSRITLIWRESGGPKVEPPARRGFGSRLIKSVMPKVELTFDPAGVVCAFELNLRSHHTAREAVAFGHGVDERAPVANDVEKPLRGQRALIVEDEVLSLLALRSALEEAGAEIAGAASTLDEAKALVDQDINFAILDINLGGDMSFSVAEQLIGRGVPVLFATGYDAASLVPIHLRTIPTLQKPIDDAVLICRLAELGRESN